VELAALVYSRNHLNRLGKLSVCEMRSLCILNQFVIGFRYIMMLIENKRVDESVKKM